MDVPAIGHTLARSLMPQIKDVHDFLDELELHGIANGLQTLDPATLRSTQSEFDANKVYDMMSDHGEKRPIIASNDGYVLDGHHRWLEAHNKGEKVDAHVCDAPILELLAHAKRYVKLGIGLHEHLEAIEQKGGIEHKDFGPMLDTFVKFASDHLGLKSLPNVRLKGADDKYNSFAAYRPGDKDVSVHITNRHPMDVFRSVAHELVHHKQNEDGKLYDGAGETGSDIEDEANFMAGRIMRHWAKENSHCFGHAYIAEEAAIVVGGPCSGKDRIARQLQEMGQHVISLDEFDLEYVETLNEMLKAQKYSPSLYFVDTTNEVSRLRNEARAAKGQRVLNEGVRIGKFTKAQESKAALYEMFGTNFHIIDNSLTEAAKPAAKKPAAKKKLVKKKPAAKPAKQAVEVKVKVEQPKAKSSSSSSSSSATKKKPAKKKPQKPDANKLKIDQENKNMMAQHFQARALEFQQKIDVIRNAMMRLQPAGKNYKKVHAQLRQQMAGANLGLRKYQKQSFSQYAPPKPADDKKKKVNEAFESLLEHAGEWGTDALRERYQRDTPGQENNPPPVKKYQDIYAKEEDGPGIGPTTITNRPPWPHAGVGIGGYSGLAEHVYRWATNPRTIERFVYRYGDLAEQKILETAEFLSKQNINNTPRTLKAMQESIDKGVGDMGTVPNQGKEDHDLDEENEPKE